MCFCVWFFCQVTSRSRSSLSTEVSSYKKCTAIGPQKHVLPIGAAVKFHSFATLFSEFAVILRHPFSVVTTTSQRFSDHLSSSQFLQLFSTGSKLFHPSPSQLNSFHLFPALLNSSQLFSATLTSAHLAFTLLNLPQLFSPLATSSTLPTTSHLHFTHLTSFSAHLKSSHHLKSGQLVSQRCLHTEQTVTQRR